MHHWRSQAGIALSAALLTSLLATSTAATAFAVTNGGNANPSLNVVRGTTFSVPISYVWNGTGPSDTLGAAGTTIVVTLPTGYQWVAAPTFTSNAGTSIALSGPVLSANYLTETWTLGTSILTVPWTLTMAGGTVQATAAAVSGLVTLRVGTGTITQIASLTPVAAVPLTISPTSVPADGSTTITLTFGTPAVSCANTASLTIATTGGTFTTTNLPGVTIPVDGSSATVFCSNFGIVSGRTLTLRAPATAGTAIITVTLAGATVADSTTLVTFTAVTVTPSLLTIGEKGHGAARVAFYSTGMATSALGCAVAPATATIGATTYGFALMTATGNGRLNVEVSLKGLPAGVGTVAVYQVAGASCSHSSIRINARGNGNRHFRLDLAGTTQVWVTASGTAGVFVTPAVTVTAKTHGPKNKGNNGNQGNKSNDQGQNEDNDD